MECCHLQYPHINALALYPYLRGSAFHYSLLVPNSSERGDLAFGSVVDTSDMLAGYLQLRQVDPRRPLRRSGQIRALYGSFGPGPRLYYCYASNADAVEPSDEDEAEGWNQHLVGNGRYVSIHSQVLQEKVLAHCY